MLIEKDVSNENYFNLLPKVSPIALNKVAGYAKARGVVKQNIVKQATCIVIPKYDNQLWLRNNDLADDITKINQQQKNIKNNLADITQSINQQQMLLLQKLEKFNAKVNKLIEQINENKDNKIQQYNLEQIRQKRIKLEQEIFSSNNNSFSKYFKKLYNNLYSRCK
ncbi:hypothetical protein [Bartonella sp. DGB1]|uniref:hypothetical protein n=1 Tax=Bartonella sp. DGB1 TaxID=3239807 RepID=UPI0035251A34